MGSRARPTGSLAQKRCSGLLRGPRLALVEPSGGSDERPRYPDLAGVAASARRWWWALLVGALAGAALATVTAGSNGSSYRASVKLLVGPIGGEYSLLRAAGQQAETYADLATSRPVVSASRARLGTQRSVEQLRGDVLATADDATRVLTISAQADTPAAAAATVNVLASELQRATRANNRQSGHELRVVEAAQVPSAPVGRRTKILVAIAVLAGLLGMLTLVVIVDIMRGRAAGVEELAAASRASAEGAGRV
jgi:capsular polysaccharide biosynthesis protein